MDDNEKAAIAKQAEDAVVARLAPAFELLEYKLLRTKAECLGLTLGATHALQRLVIELVKSNLLDPAPLAAWLKQFAADSIKRRPIPMDMAFAELQIILGEYVQSAGLSADKRVEIMNRAFQESWNKNFDLVSELISDSEGHS